MKTLYHLEQTVRLDEMEALRRQWQETLLASGGEAEAVGDLVLALNEAVINSLRHGYQQPAGWVQIIMRQVGQSLHITHCDQAPAFDPTSVPPPDTSISPLLRPPGGVGIHMMRTFTDELHYERTENGRNQIAFIKHSVFR
jgi:serine/threonine-protein kinase RsbW